MPGAHHFPCWILVSLFPVSLLLSQEDAAAPATPAGESLPELIVHGQKVPTPLQQAPLSETAVTAEVIRATDVKVIQDAVKFAPNTFITEFTVRKVSNPFFRGIAGSPINPGVTTYYDGIPILHGNAANLNFLNVDQIELVRGPQSTLFGRNNVGGSILNNSADPADFWTAASITSAGSYALVDTRTTISGPLSDTARIAVSGGYEKRDGYHENDVTGNDVDYRDGRFGKVQLLLQPSEDLSMRFTVSGESDKDGDYGLQDLAALRQRPYRVQRDFEGFAERDVVLTSFDLRRNFGAVDFSSLTGYLNWNTRDATDLDYSAIPGIIRRDEEEADQFTQEFRLSSAPGSPLVIGNGAGLSWQAGLFLFTQDYAHENLTDANAPFAGSHPWFGFFPFMRRTWEAELEDFGVGLYTQGTLRLNDRLDLTAGVRGDYEDKEARIATATSVPPFFAMSGRQSLDAEYTAVSPTFAVGLDLTRNLRAYTTAAKGYRAGGFNVFAPAGFEQYKEETSWNYEGGLKGTWRDGRVQANAAFFYTHWEDVQINVWDAANYAGFYIDNLGRAVSKGIELNLQLRPCENFFTYASLGLTDTGFLSGSLGGDERTLGGGRVPIDGNKLPFVPDYTASAGAEASFPLPAPGLELYARADVTCIGQYVYSASNAQGQEAYALADFRLGLRKDAWFLEGWVRNAFDEDYIPIAIPMGALAPSGWMGENGAPATFGLRFGLTF